MADKNINAGNQSQQFNTDGERNRYHQDQEWQSSRYDQEQNREGGQGFRDVGYSGDSARGMDAKSQSEYDRLSHYSDSGNRNYGQQSYDHPYGYQGSQGGHRTSGFRNEDRNQYGQSHHEGHQPWNQQRSAGNQYDGNPDWNRRQSQQSSGGQWGSDYGRQDWGRSQVNNDQDNWHRDDRDYGNNAGQGHYGQVRQNYGHNDWGRNRGQYGHQSGYRNDRRDRDGDNWWERTKDKVSSWFGDDDNNNRRNVYDGGHRGKGPNDYRRSQDRIREDICDRLTDDDRVDASHIRVQIEDDAVILSGTVSSRDEKRRAEDVVESVSGVRNVENRLRVGKGLTSHEYTGNTENTGGIGNESGTTNEIIRNHANERNTELDKGRNKAL